MVLGECLDVLRLTGQFENGNDTESEYRAGAAPQVRVGRMVSTHWMVSVNWEQWLTELGEDEVKFRRSLQNLGLGITYFPGDPSGPVYGLFIRAGAGMGWAGTGAKEAIEGESQHKGERIDEWGVGAFAEAGYEFCHPIYMALLGDMKASLEGE